MGRGVTNVLELCFLLRGGAVDNSSCPYYFNTGVSIGLRGASDCIYTALHGAGARLLGWAAGQMALLLMHGISRHRPLGEQRARFFVMRAN